MTRERGVAAGVAAVVALVFTAAIDSLAFPGHRISGVLFWLAMGTADGLLAGAWGTLRFPATVQGPNTRPLVVGFVFAFILLALWVTPLANLAFLGLVVALLATPVLDRSPDPKEATHVLLGAAAAFALTVPLAWVGVAKAADSVKVDAARGWVATGLTVQSGQYVVVQAKGTVEFLAGDDKAKAGPDGAPVYYQGCGGPTYCGALVAKVVVSDKEEGGVHAAGTGAFTADKSGTVHLAVNDFDFTDNKGSFEVTVEIGTPPPKPNQFGGSSFGGGSSPTPNLPVSTETPSESKDQPGLPPLVAALFAALGAALGTWATRRTTTEPARDESAAGTA